MDASKLDAGNYKTTPRAALGEAGKPEVGALLEAQRLANYVTGPWEVDPSLTAPLAFGIGPGSLALPGGAKALTTFFSPDQNEAMAIDGYLYGFATARQVAKQKQLMNVVLRFTDPAAASNDPLKCSLRAREFRHQAARHLLDGAAHAAAAAGGEQVERDAAQDGRDACAQNERGVERPHRGADEHAGDDARSHRLARCGRRWRARPGRDRRGRAA